jgi:hypothetical protein
MKKNKEKRDNKFFKYNSFLIKRLDKSISYNSNIIINTSHAKRYTYKSEDELKKIKIKDINQYEYFKSLINYLLNSKEFYLYNPQLFKRIIFHTKYYDTLFLIENIDLEPYSYEDIFINLDRLI